MSRRAVALSIAGILIFLGWLPVLLVRAGLLPNLLFLGGYDANLLGLVFVLGIVVTVFVVVGLGLAYLATVLTRRGRLAERAVQSAAHRDFLRRLDHEMKNPLTTIRVGLLNLEQSLLPEQQGSLTRIVQQTQRIQRLVEDLRSLTEIEEYTLEKTSVDVRLVLESAIAMVCNDPDFQQRTIDLQIQQIPWPLPAVNGDPELLLIVFRNLLDNALKYTRPQGKIVVRTSEDGRMALVEVADIGIGIPPEDLDHVFEDLYRGQNARGVPGHGLGLPLVKRIVSLHAGRIEINSRLDQGTVLKVWLPVAGKG